MVRQSAKIGSIAVILIVASITFGVDMQGERVKNCADPTDAQDAATMQYVLDTAAAAGHNILSSAHGDTTNTGVPTRGSMMIANATPKWAESTIGAAGTIWHSDGTDPSWAATTNITTLGTIVTGTWQATDIGIAYGGTGASTLNDLIALTTHTTGNYAAGDGEAGSALIGDTATAFFSAGTIEHEYGGLEANVSAYTGLLAISGGATAEIDALSELEGQIADVTAFVVEGTACSDIEGTGLSIGAGTLNWSAASTDLTDTADLLYEAELDTFSELQAQIADKTLVNEEDAISSIDIDGGAIDGTIIGASSETTGKFTDLTLTAPAADVKWTADSLGYLALESQVSNIPANLQLYAKDGDGTDIVRMTIWAEGTVDDITDSSRLMMNFSPSGANDRFEIRSLITGSGTLRPIHLFTGANSSQLVLNTDGNSGFGGNLGMDGTLTVGGTSTFNNAVSIISGSTSAFSVGPSPASPTLVVDAANNRVGIGTAVPLALLHLEGSNATMNPVLRLHNTGSQAGDIISIEFRHHETNLQAFIKDEIGAGWPTKLHFGTALSDNNAITQMTIDGNGKVGIGTTSPRAKLEVFGGEIWMFDNGDSPRFVIGDTSAAGNYGYMQWDSTNDQVRIGTDAGGDTVTITETGNVGIGTATPGASLHIAKSLGTPTDLGDYNNYQLVVEGGVGTGNTAAILFSSTITSYGGSAIIHYDTGAGGIGDLAFYTKQSIAAEPPVEVMRLDDAGNVGIGTVSPDGKLSIGGDSGSQFNIKTITEEVTIAVGDGADPVVVTSGNLAPAGSLIMGVVFRVTDAPGGGATTIDIGRTNGGNLDEFIDGASCDVLDETGDSYTSGDAAHTGIQRNVSADTLTLTTDADVTGDEMKVRIVVFYQDLTAPTN